MTKRHAFAAAALVLPLALMPAAAIGEGIYVSPTGEGGGVTEQAQDPAGAPSPVSPAAQGSEGPAIAQAYIARQQQSQTLASSLIGQEVTNPQGESIGEITDLLLDERGELTALIVEVGGFLGLGGKTIGVALDKFNQEANETGEPVMVLPVRSEELEQIAEFKSAREIERERDAAERAAERAREGQNRVQRPGAIPAR